MDDRDRFGFELPLLLAAAFRGLIDDLHDRLAAEGHPHARPLHGFALQAVGPDGVSVSELGRRLGVSKQAAAKSVRALEQLDYVARATDPSDGRAVRIVRTARGDDMLQRSAAVFEELRAGWKRELGAQRLRELEDGLQRIVGARETAAPIGDLPGWLR